MIRRRGKKRGKKDGLGRKIEKETVSKRLTDNKLWPLVSELRQPMVTPQRGAEIMKILSLSSFFLIFPSASHWPNPTGSKAASKPINVDIQASFSGNRAE